MVPHRKRCKRYNSPGHAHALTFSCFRRQPFLSRDRVRAWLVAAIDRARVVRSFDLWAYVIMPEHAHLLIRPCEPGYDISAILASIKLPVAKRAISYVRKFAPSYLPRMLDRQPNGRQHHRLWQRGGGYDRNVIEPSTARKLIEYIHANPVRRGLCDRPEEWPWSSAAQFAGLPHGPLRVDYETTVKVIG